MNGLLDMDPKLFTLLQSDVDGAGMKVMNFARSLMTLCSRPTREGSGHQARSRELGAPALRNAGLMLVHVQRGDC